MHVRPAGETLELSETIPANPLRAVMVIVDVPEPGAWKLKLAGLAAIVKSWTAKVTVAECVSDPLVPVTVAV